MQCFVWYGLKSEEFSLPLCLIYLVVNYSPIFRMFFFFYIFITSGFFLALFRPFSFSAIYVLFQRCQRKWEFRRWSQTFQRGNKFYISHKHFNSRFFFFFCSFTNVVASISLIFVLNRNRIYCRREHFLCVSILPRHWISEMSYFRWVLFICFHTSSNFAEWAMFKL